YFDVFVEYAKADADDILIKITAHNRGPEVATLHLLPQVFFRNTWSWDGHNGRPEIGVADSGALELRHKTLGTYYLHFEDDPELLFTENDTNVVRLYGTATDGRFYKDAFHEYVMAQNHNAINPNRRGTKAAIHVPCVIAPGSSRRLRLRLSRIPKPQAETFADFDTV